MIQLLKSGEGRPLSARTVDCSPALALVAVAGLLAGGYALSQQLITNSEDDAPVQAEGPTQEEVKRPPSESSDSNVPQVHFNEDGVWHDFAPDQGEGRTALNEGPWFPFLKLGEDDLLGTERTVPRPRRAPE
jgi:hypothetical protein